MARVALVGILLAHALAVPAAAGASTAVIGAPPGGLVTLRELGADAIVLEPGAARRTEVTIPLRFAPGARQGPARWYVGHMPFRIEVDPRSGDGLVYVEADVNAYTFAQVKFWVERRAGDLAVRWTSVNIHGLLRGTLANGRGRIPYANYLQTRAVRGGPGTATFRVLTTERARVARVTVPSSAGIEETGLSPYRLKLDARVDNAAEPRVGEPMNIRYAVSSRHGEPVHGVRVRLVFDPAHFALADGEAPVRTIGTVTGRQSGTIALVPRQPGRWPVQAAGTSAANDLSVYLVARVAPARASAPSRRTLWAAVLAGGLALATAGGVAIVRGATR